MAIEKRMVKRTFDLLLGKDVDVNDAKKVDSSGNVVIGQYINGDGETVGAIVFDLKLACYSAAALSLLPANTADETIKGGKLDEPLRSNAYEVLNVGVGFFSDGSTPDMRLSGMYSNGEELPEEVRTVFAKAYTDLSVKVDIPGYGSGNGSLYLS